MSAWRRLDLVLPALALCGIAAAIHAAPGAPASGPASVPPLGTVPWPAEPSDDSLADAADRVTATDPFRLDRQPAALPYEPAYAGAAPVAPRPPRPALVLKGVVGAGDRSGYAALLDGLPGHGETLILRAGDTAGGLRVRTVGRDTVVVTAADTTWRLTIRKAWQ